MPKVSTLPTYAEHKKLWEGCEGCVFCTYRSRQVFGRGSLQAKFLFIGDSPRDNDDTSGQPFSGPAGDLLDRLWQRALREARIFDEPKVAFTNLVACRSKVEREKDGITKVERIDPRKAEVEACSDRLNEFVSIVAPEAIIRVGKVAATWVPRLVVHQPTFSLDIAHPIRILGEDRIKQHFLEEETASALRDLLWDWNHA